MWLIGLLAAGLLLSPGRGYGQEVPPADPVFPFPIYHDRPETGGLYVTDEFVMYRQTNPLQHQPIAVRGFFDVDGSITGHPGGHVGSFQPVLFADDAGGPGTYQPGLRLGIGWRFRDGLSVEVSWMNLFKAEYFAVRTLATPGFQSDPFLADTFLSAPVYNFPSQFSGPQIKEVALATFPTLHTLNTGYGIWNAADEMSISFVQRFEQIDAVGRVPIFETDCDRCYGRVGFRFSWIWEQFKWRTVDNGFIPNSNINPTVDIDPFTGRIFDPHTLINTQLSPDTSPLNAAIYTNTVSNRMYGPVVGFGNEYYIGHGFSVSVDVLAGLYLDVVKEIAKYELGQKDQAPQIRRGITTYKMAEEVQASLSLWWYPIEGVQVQFGYDVMGFFNTIAAKEPVSFNYGGLDPAWTEVFRFFDGLHVGIGITF
jgi:hypothetical protein